MKRLSIIALLAFALVLLYGGVAYANFGPHGGYATDTDACAGCHRAHTSFSPITWTDTFDNTTQHSALLVSGATTMEEFCYACHGDGAPGASTNVQSGVFDSGPSYGTGAPGGPGAYAYQTNSRFNGALNGGGFSLATTNGATWRPVTSMHNMEDGTTVSAWGVGNSYNDKSYDLKCTDCHDPHGSSNYRILKDTVNAHAVGGYDASETPQPFVISAEQGYPTGGWLLHAPGQAQVASYLPNYTAPEYAYKGPVGGYQRSMSAWCSACHERYIDNNDTTGTAQLLPWVTNTSSDTYDYGPYEGDYEATITAQTGIGVGPRARHRHKVNITLTAGRAPANSLQREVLTNTVLPLEMQPGQDSATFRGGLWDYSDYMGCLTCHFAHGTSADMTGWAEASLVTSSSAVVSWYPVPDTQPIATGGVNPNKSSALLRANNRGVCERCHNK